MKIYELKVWPRYFRAVLDGSKTFEFRKDDRGFELGDTLILREFEPGVRDYSGQVPIIKESRYTGRSIKKKITYIFKGGIPGCRLRQGLVILALGEYIEKGSITDEEIDAFGKFTDEQKKIIKEKYSKYPKGFFPNPICALY